MTNGITRTLTCVLVAGALPVWAQGESDCDVTALTSLASTPGGACWDGSHLWVSDFFTSTLRRVDLSSGATVATLTAPGSYVGGMAWDGAALWVLPEQLATIYRIDPQTGAVLRSIPAPSAGQPDPNGSGLAWDGAALWHADYGRRMLYRLDPLDGSVLASWPAPGSRPAGLGWSSGTLVLADPVDDLVYHIDELTGAVLRACPTLDRPWGVAVTGDGRGLMVTWSPMRVLEFALEPPDEPPFWETVCRARPNSTGAPAELRAEGSPSAAREELVLVAGPLPDGFGFLLMSPRQTERELPFGTLCVGHPRSRGRVAYAAGGEWRQQLDLRRCGRGRHWPRAGESWTFQLFFRDRGWRPASALSDAIVITFEE
jgi:hypothetical protein